jgi:hypothetical protein
MTMVDVVQLKAEQIDRLNEAVKSFLNGPGERSVNVVPSRLGIKVILLDCELTHPQLGESESEHFVDALANAIQGQVAL